MQHSIASWLDVSLTLVVPQSLINIDPGISVLEQASELNRKQFMSPKAF